MLGRGMHTAIAATVDFECGRALGIVAALPLAAASSSALSNGAGLRRAATDVTPSGANPAETATPA